MLQVRSGRASAFCTLAAVSLVIVWAALRAGPSSAAYRPARDSKVVFELPRRANAQGRSENILRARLASDPRDVRAAMKLARVQIDAARESGDLSPLGRAEAILAPFAEPARDAQVLVLRATIAQARHDFTAALSDLERALRLDGDDAQAHLTRASILTVLGRYAEARASCAPLAQLAPPLVELLCRANIDGLTGARTSALASFEAALAGTRTANERAWALSLLCEHAFWDAQPRRAERACREALAIAPRDRYTRALLADVLLELDEPERALALTEQHGDDDALLLRRALAARALGRAEAASLVATLEARFQRSRRRGDRVHQREEARLLLALGQEPARALALARAGFAAQREPWDLRVLLAAALAAGQKQAAAPALSFMREQHVTSALLDALATRLGSAS